MRGCTDSLLMLGNYCSLVPESKLLPIRTFKFIKLVFKFLYKQISMFSSTKLQYN